MSCIKGRRVKFAYWKDNIGIPYTMYEEIGEDKNLNARCIKKSFTCSNQITTENYCPANFLTPLCKSQLNVNCSRSGLFKEINRSQFNQDVYDFVLPPSCDVGMYPNLSKTEFYSKCLSYVFNYFITGSLNFNTNNLLNIDRILYASKPLSRLLQTTDMPIVNTLPSEVIILIPEKLDPTKNDSVINIIRTKSINSTNITIDGISDKPITPIILENWGTNISTSSSDVTPSVDTNPNNVPKTNSSKFLQIPLYIILICFALINFFEI
jgi:hypothetical protein